MRFLSIATFRIDRPARHREDRLSAVHDALKSSGWTAQHLAIVAASSDVPASRHWQVPVGAPGDPDGAIIASLLADRVSFDSTARLLDDYAPDVVWLEGPWPWAFLRRYLADRKRHDLRIVYSAEAEDAADWLDTRSGDMPDLRKDLLAQCHGVAVADRPALDILSQHHANVRLFRNGTWPRLDASGAASRDTPTKTGRTCLYVGSGSADRTGDLVAILGDCLSYLAPNERIIVADDLYGELERTSRWDVNKALNLSRLSTFDAGSVDRLREAVDSADVVMLPFRSRADIGADVARALFARKPIVATPEAMAPYADVSDRSDIVVTDDATVFRQALLRFMRHPAQERTPSDEEAARLRGLLWESTLGGLDPWLRQMLGSTDEARPARSSLAQTHRPDAGDERIVYDALQIHRMLEEGWHPYEPEGTWSRQRTASLRMPEGAMSGDGEGGAYAVTLTVEAYTPLWRTLELDVFSDRTHYASCRFSRKKRVQSIGFIIDADPLGDEAEIVLYFQCTQIVSPLVARMGSDARSLGIRVKTLSLTRCPDTA